MKLILVVYLHSVQFIYLKSTYLIVNQPIRLLPFLAFVLIKEKKVTTMSKKARKAICYTQVIVDLILKANNISPQMSSTSTRQHPSYFLFFQFLQRFWWSASVHICAIFNKKNHESSVWQLNNSFCPSPYPQLSV